MFFLLYAGVHSQTLSPRLIASAGGSSSVAGGTVSWTMGETNIATFISGTTILSQGIQQPEVDILTGSITGTAFCAGVAVSVPFTASGYYGSGNVFTAQLSNGSGSFASPVNIGTLTSTVSGTVSATIPANTASGTGYRIRVTANLPNYTGLDNGADITIRPQFTTGEITTTGETICYNASPAAAIGNAADASGGDLSITYSWRSSADGYAAAIDGAIESTYLPSGTFTTTTSYKRYAKDNTCNTTPEVSTGTWTVTVIELPVAGTNGTLTICAGTTVTAEQLFAQLGGSPDAGGAWTPTLGGAGTYTYTVTATSPCTEADASTVTVTEQAQPNAGTNGSVVICAGSNVTEAQLYAAITGEDAGGIWTPTLGGAGTYTYTVSATSPCTGTATATVTVTEQVQPVAGTNGTLTICAGTTVTAEQLFAQLGGSPDAGGAWTPTLAGAGTYTYTVSATSPCTTVATATVAVTENQPVVANAGSDLDLCSASSTFLVGNEPAPGTGQWTRVSGPNTPSIYPPSGNIAILSGLITSDIPYIYRYTIINGVCTRADEVMIYNEQVPTAAYAGENQTLCSTITSVTLTGNTPVYGTGTWTQVAGTTTATLTVGNPVTVSGLVAGTYTFAWEISNGTCPPYRDLVDVILIPPCDVYAGPDKTICEGSTIRLDDATSSNCGNMHWSTNGDGAFNDINALHPVYTPGLNDKILGSVVLRMDCSSCCSVTCPPDFDVMTLNISEPPTAYADAASTPEDVTLAVAASPATGLLSNDTDPESDPLTVTQFVVGITTHTLVSGTASATQAEGVITIHSDGSYTFVPTPNYYGTVPVITYTISDGNGGTSSSTLTITVTSVNEFPIAVNDAKSTHDTPVTADASVNDTPSPDGGNTWELEGASGGAVHGTVSMTSVGVYTYTPSPSYHGLDVFTYKLCDVDGDCATATVTIATLPVIQCHDDIITCINAVPFDLYTELGGSYPPDGDFSGEGVTDGFFYPLEAETGSHTITYTYTMFTYVNTCTTVIGVDAANAITIAGQVKYWNSEETYMETPFPTDINGTRPPDYFYVALYEATHTMTITNPLDGALEWKKVDVTTAEAFNNETGVWDVSMDFMSYFKFNTLLDPTKQYYMTVWDGSNVYQEFVNTGTQTGNLYNPELGSSYTWRSWGGVSALDALAMQYMISGATPINDDPYSWYWVGNNSYIFPATVDLSYGFYSNKIADVNSVNGITALDALTTQYRIAGLQPTFPNNTPNFQVAGRFVETIPVKTFPDPSVTDRKTPFTLGNYPDLKFTKSSVPYTYFSMAISHYYKSADFNSKTYTQSLNTPVGSCPDYGYINIYYTATGDVNSSYIPPTHVFKGENPSVSLAYDDELIAQKGEIVSIPVRIDRTANLGAITLGMKYRKDLIKVIEVPGYDVVKIDQEQGTVRLAWADLFGKMVFANDVILTVKVMVLADILPDNRLFELESITELGEADAKRMEGVTLKTSSIATQQAQNADMFITNYPNPFEAKTTFTYSLPEPGKVKLEVYNKLGQMIRTLVDMDQNVGLHNLETDNFDLAPGVYTYRLVLQGAIRSYTASKSMVILRK